MVGKRIDSSKQARHSFVSVHTLFGEAETYYIRSRTLGLPVAVWALHEVRGRAAMCGTPRDSVHRSTWLNTLDIQYTTHRRLARRVRVTERCTRTSSALQRTMGTSDITTSLNLPSTAQSCAALPGPSHESACYRHPLT